MISTDIDFPAELPLPLREGYGFKHAETFKRTEMQSGRPRYRRIPSGPSIVPVYWMFRQNQAAAFEAWYRDSINDGAAWFNFKLLTPIGMLTAVCHFKQMYEGPELVGLSSWRISAELEVWSRPLLPPGWGNFPEFVTGASIFDIAMNQKWPRA